MGLILKLSANPNATIIFDTLSEWTEVVLLLDCSGIPFLGDSCSGLFVMTALPQSWREPWRKWRPYCERRLWTLRPSCRAPCWAATDRSCSSKVTPPVHPPAAEGLRRTVHTFTQ